VYKNHSEVAWQNLNKITAHIIGLNPDVYQITGRLYTSFYRDRLHSSTVKLPPPQLQPMTLFSTPRPASWKYALYFDSKQPEKMPVYSSNSSLSNNKPEDTGYTLTVLTYIVNQWFN
jgi:hypothetical protein